MILLWFLVVLGKVISDCVLHQSPIVHLNDGTIVGTVNKTEGKGLIYHAYRGIPYAAPPVGCLRFKAPQPPKKWSGTLDATKDGPQCVQNTVLNTSEGKEDCLTINVYTPAASCKSKKIPTMVWIYGGGFIGGSSQYKEFGPDYLLENCVCFVSFNYRVGVLGFLSTGDTAALGNYGLKDQVFAFKWIRNNIEKFGGDPNNVLAFGESAGAASVSILSQIKSTRGLFHKAILQSGTSLCMWSKARHARKLAFQIGRQLNIDTSNSTHLIESLRAKSSKEIQEAFYKKWLPIGLKLISKDPVNNLMGIGPVIEPPSSESLLTSYSFETLSSGNSHKIPMIIGFNNNEASAADKFPYSILLKLWGLSYQNFMSNVVPIDMNIFSLAKRVAARLKITEKYFGLIPSIGQTFPKFLKYVSETMFIKPIIKAAQLQSKISNVFLYQFSYLSKWGSNTNRSETGVGHAEELSYIFKKDHNFAISEAEQKIRKFMCKMWTNMAHTGNPSINPPQQYQLEIKWSPVNSTNTQLLDINKNCHCMTKNPYADTLDFWDNLYNNFGNRPFDTY